MGTGIGHPEKVMCPILNHGYSFAIIYDRTYSKGKSSESHCRLTSFLPYRTSPLALSNLSPMLG